MTNTFFYARTNPYGSETSMGFANTMAALVFASKAERDTHVADNAHRNLAVVPLTKRDALKLAERNGSDRYLSTVDGHLVNVG